MKQLGVEIIICRSLLGNKGWYSRHGVLLRSPSCRIFLLKLFICNHLLNFLLILCSENFISWMLKCFCGNDLSNVAFFRTLCCKFIQYLIKHCVFSFMLSKILLRNGFWFEEIIHLSLRKILGIFFLNNLKGKLGFEHSLVEELLFKCTTSNKPIDKHRLLLSNTVCATNRLFFPLR